MQKEKIKEKAKERTDDKEHVQCAKGENSRDRDKEDTFL